MDRALLGEVNGHLRVAALRVQLAVVSLAVAAPAAAQWQQPNGYARPTHYLAEPG